MNENGTRPLQPQTDQTGAQADSSPAPLIVTKLRVPRRRSDLLPRRRLVDFIHTHLDRRLILVSAPAGYGKTTLLTEFAHDTDLPVCWYTLDPFDRDLHLFLEHFIAAIAQRFPAFGQRSRALLLSGADLRRNLYPVVATIVQEMYDTIPEYFVLVLDDHHLVEDQEAINEFLDLLVTYADENLHLILASRTLPALPNLSLLVARRQAAGLSIDELRFTPPEIQALALQNYGLRLSAEQAESLAERSGGWITGLLLTVTPLWEKKGQESAVQGRINVGLYDYLSRQVLDQQPPALREFLLDSSILDELSPELCSQVLEVDNPADLIDQLRIRNLFIIEFEGDDGRVRYHDLFRDFLQNTLRRRDRARFRRLMHRAAQVYAARGEWERAVSRYLALREYGPVADIVERTANSLYETGRWDTLAGWIDALPEAIRNAHPRFLMHRGQIHMERGEHAAALALYQQAEQAFTAADDRSKVAHALVMQGSLLRFQGQYPAAISYCRQALALVSQATAQEKHTVALACKNIGLCQLRLGQLAEGRDTLQQALHLYEELGALYDVGSVHHDLGLSCELGGDFEGAIEHYQAALRCWQRLGNPGPWANTLNGLAVIYSLRGEYDRALQLLNEALSKARQAGSLRAEALIWASLGDLHRDLGAYEQARQAYDQGLQAATQAGYRFVVTYTLDALGNVARLQGHLAEAARQLHRAMECATAYDSVYEIGLCHISLGILAAAEKDLEAARQHLDRAIDILRSGGFRRELGRAYLHRAQMEFLADDRSRALADLHQALIVAQELGADQFLVVEGQNCLPLLRYAAREGADSALVEALLERIAAHQARAARQPEPVVVTRPGPALKIYALGQPQVEMNGQVVQWPTLQSRDLFFCLLQHRAGLRKEEIGNLFWPNHLPLRLDGIFRSTLYRLRRTLFRDSILFEGGVYRFNWQSNCWFDVEAFDRLLATVGSEEIARLEEAIALYRGDYLEGVYGDWCVVERERLRERYLSALERLGRLYADRRDLQRAVDLYQRLLVQDPYREAIHRELMRCYYRQGDRAAAIRQYQTCARLLREDLGLSPSPETEALYLQVIG